MRPASIIDVLSQRLRSAQRDGRFIDRPLPKSEDGGRSPLAPLFDVLLPSGQGVAVMLRAYFDESGTQGGATALWVVGCLFEPDRCLELERQWTAELKAAGVSIFHMVDCAARKGEFELKSREDCDRLYRNLLDLIQRQVAVWAAVAVNPEVFNQLRPAGWRESFGGAYAACAMFCLKVIGKWCRDNSYTDRVAYFFEAGHESAGEANACMNFIATRPELTTAYHYSSHTFIRKQDAVPLQAADIIAWEMNKETVEQSFQPRRREARKSLRSLGGLLPNKVLLLTPPRLRRYFDKVTHLLED